MRIVRVDLDNQVKGNGGRVKIQEFLISSTDDSIAHSDFTVLTHSFN